MKDVTPRRSSTKRSFGKAILFIAGLIYAVRELRSLWRELAALLRRRQ